MEENKKALENESLPSNEIIAQKESFILFVEQRETVEALPDEEAGKLIKGIYAYAAGESLNLSGAVKIAFIPIRQQMDRNAKKYEEIKEKRRLAGSQGGKQRVANQANATFAKQTQANDKQSLANQADNVNDNDNKKIIYIEDTKKENFKKPTIEEIRNYCLERNNNIDAQSFYDYYCANGWKVGKNPMKDWKATVRNWERSSKTKTNREEQTEYVYNPYL